MIIPLRNVGIAGEVKDILPENVPTNAVTSARNCRIESQSLRSFSNARESSNYAPDSVKYGKTFWRVEGDGFIVVKESGGATEVVFTDKSGIDTDITPVVPPTNSEYWYGVQSGEWFILTNGIDVPIFTTAALPQMVDLPGWPANYSAKVIENYKNFLVAVQVTKDAVFEPTMVKWSHPVSPGDTTTFWDFTDPTLLAGETVLQEPGRQLIALQPYRDTCMVFFDRATWRMDNVGGQFVMNFQRAWGDDGIVSEFAHTVGNNVGFVFGHRDIYTHDGHSKTSITDLRMTKYIYDTLDFAFEMDAEWYPKRNEVFFLGRSHGSGDGNLLYIYNTNHDAWTESLVELNGEGVLSHLSVGPRLSTGIVTYDDWTTETYPDFDSTPYSALVTGDETVTIYGISESQGVTYDLDYSGTTPAPTTLFRENLLIEHNGIDLDELGEGVGAKIIYLNRVFPQIHGTGSVIFTFGVSRTANSAIDWYPSVAFDLDDPQDYAVDIRIAGRYLSYRIEPGPTTPLFSYTGLDLDVTKVGAV